MNIKKRGARFDRLLLVIIALIPFGCSQPKDSSVTTDVINEKPPEMATLVVTPDRGFAGNEEIRQAVSKIGQATDILFVTDQQSKQYLHEMFAQW